MKPLNEKDYSLFQSLAGLTQKELRATMTSFLKSKYKNVIAKNEFIIAVGEIPIALVAHMDTVFKTPPTKIFYDEKKTIMWSPQGLGADDRAGVFAIIKIIQSGLRPSIIFTTDEEKGCIGADALVEIYPKAPMNLNYVIQLDRRGSNDCVFYDCDNRNFVEYVEKFGFAENYGSFSDISEICPAWKIAGVNLSVGYENEHSEIETLNTTHLLQTIAKVKKMLQCDNIPKFEYIPSKYAWYGRPYAMWPGEDEEYSWYFDNNFKCKKCGKEFSEYDVLPIISSEPPYEMVYYCPDCCISGIDWCIECNEGYEVSEPNTPSGQCPRCRAKKIYVKGGNNSGK